jgi:phosphinothricin acetyltransferase
MRPIAGSDHARAAAIYNHYVATSTATFQTEPLGAAEWAADSIGGEPGRHGAWAITAGDAGGDPGGTLVGYVLVQPFKSRCAYRDTAEVTVYLAPEATERGLGGAALRHVDEHARAHGLHALIAVVCAENDASLRTFERHGYERVAHLKEVGSKFGRLLDVVYLEKVLSGLGSEP